MNEKVRRTGSLKEKKKSGEEERAEEVKEEEERSLVGRVSIQPERAVSLTERKHNGRV